MCTNYERAWWDYAWRARRAHAKLTDEAGCRMVDRASEALMQQCLNVEETGFKRVVFSGEEDMEWTSRIGRELWAHGGVRLMGYAVFDLAVKLMEEGCYDLLCDVFELMRFWNIQ